MRECRGGFGSFGKGDVARRIKREAFELPEGFLP